MNKTHSDLEPNIYSKSESNLDAEDMSKEVYGLCGQVGAKSGPA